MTDQEFPTRYFLGTIVRLLDTVKHQDTNYTYEERVRNLQYAYNEAAKHFAQPKVQDALKLKPKKLEAALQTITGMVVYCWVNATPQLMASLTIHYTYTLILDDSEDNPDQAMQTFFQDMMAGKPQRHPWWRLVNDHFPKVLSHYGPFCALNIYRSTVDCKSLIGALVSETMVDLMWQSSRAAGSSSTISTDIAERRTTRSSCAA
jgi:trichodiene synthase